MDDEREYEEEFVRRRSLEDEARERERERERELGRAPPPSA